MASPGTAATTAPGTGRTRYRSVPAWLLWLVLATHVVGIEWVARHTTGRSLLQSVSEPSFNQPLALQDPANSSQNPPSDAGAAQPATPTVGQVVQARTVELAPALPDTPAAQPERPTPRKAASPKPKLPARTPEEAAGSVAPLAAVPDSAANPVAKQALPDAQTENFDQKPLPDQPGKLPGTVESPTLASSPMPPLAASPSTAPSTSPSPTSQPSTVAALDDPAVWLAAWPRSTRLNYTLKGYYRGDFFGHARVQWQRSDQRYQAQIHVNVGLLMDMRMTSQGRITATRLWPEAYEEDRRGKKRSARFGDQMVTLDSGNTLNRPAHLQDTASQFVQLAQDFATRRQPLQVGAVVPVTLGRPGGIDDWVYDVVAKETVATPLGELAAFHLKPRPIPNARGTVSAEMWFAPALQHLPVRIRLSLNPETWLDLTLDNLAQSD